MISKQDPADALFDIISISSWFGSCEFLISKDIFVGEKNVEKNKNK